MNKEKAKEYYQYLDEKYSLWCTSKLKDRSKIASEIYEYAMHWDDDIYLYLNDNRASGLFEHGSFESDIQKAFRLLRKIIEE